MRLQANQPAAGGIAIRESQSITASLLTMIGGYFGRKSAERRLRALDDRLLKDIGISRGEISSVVRRRERYQNFEPA